MLGGAGSPGGDELLTVTVVRDDHGYGMKVSGDNPVYVQSVKEHGAAWRAGLRAGDRILRVDGVPVHHHTHQQVVMMIRANATAVLTVHQNTSRHKTPITAPLPVNPEKQRQLEVSKVHTMRLMLEQEQKYIRELRNELSKVPDVRKQAQLESSEQRCATLQHEIDTVTAGQPIAEASPATPRLSRTKTNLDKPAGSPPPTSFLSGLPRSLSNLTGQSLRNLRTRQNNKTQQENQPPLVRQNSDETNKRRHVHNNTVPMVPTTCLDNTPPPLPPRSIERPKRNPLSPNMTPVNPLAKPKPCSSVSAHKYYKRDRGSPMHQSMPSYESHKLRMSSHSLDGELDGPQPNSIALQMSYPLVNVPPPPLQTDGVPVLHVRSQSSPEHLDHGLARSGWTRGTPPPGTPPPPYAHNTQPCADPQRAIISMEEEEQAEVSTLASGWTRGTPPPSAPAPAPPPYAHNTQPCADPQRAIISMEEEEQAEVSTLASGWTRGTPPPSAPAPAPPPYAHNTQPCADPQRAIISMEEEEQAEVSTLASGWTRGTPPPSAPAPAPPPYAHNTQPCADPQRAIISMEEEEQAEVSTLASGWTRGTPPPSAPAPAPPPYAHNTQPCADPQRAIISMEEEEQAEVSTLASGWTRGTPPPSAPAPAPPPYAHNTQPCADPQRAIISMEEEEQAEVSTLASGWTRGTPPPSAPAPAPPPYAHNTQPCADPQRAIISMEEEEQAEVSTLASGWTRGTPPPSAPAPAPPPYAHNTQPCADPQRAIISMEEEEQAEVSTLASGWTRGTPPPSAPAPAPPPYAHNTQPCADPQRAIISMEEEEQAEETSNPGLFSNLRTVLDSKARTAVLLNWLLGERRCACATLLLLITDGYRTAQGVSTSTLRRWAYEIQSTFLAPAAVLRPPTLDPQAAIEVEDALHDDYDKEEILRNVFRKARQKAKEEMAQQLNEFQVKRQVGLGGLYGPDDAQIERCVVDKAQEQVIVERLLVQCLSGVANAGTGGAGAAAAGGCGARAGGRAALLAALQAAALYLQCRPATVAAAAGGARAGFLQRDKLYKQRLKQLAKMNPQPFIVRGHHLQLQALTSEAHCHYCDQVIWGLAPQAYFCADCKLRVHRNCAKSVEEACCIDSEHHNNRISRLIDLIHPVHPAQDDKKSRKTASNAFLNMERSVRKLEDEQPWDQTLTPQSAQERRDESDESLYESADCHSDAISASDDAIPRLSKSPTMSKESLKLVITDEEVDCAKIKKGHRKTMSLSNPLEIVKNLGDDWFDHKKDLDKHSDKKKSRESLWSEEEKDSVHGSTTKLEQVRKNSKKEDKSNSNSRKSSTTDAPKTRKSSKGSSVSSFFLRRKKTPTTVKPVEAVAEAIDGIVSTSEILNYTRSFLEEEKRHASLNSQDSKPSEDTDSDDEPPTPKLIGEHRRRLSRQTSRSKSKVRGKSQTVKVNTLRKSHSGTLKKAKKKSIKTPLAGRSRQASVVESTPIVKKKLDVNKPNSWFHSGHRGESKREGSSEEPTAPEPEAETTETASKEPAKDTNWRAASSGGRGVNRAESCRERDPPRRGKHRNASDPNRLTAHNNHDLEGGAPTAPSGSSSSSSLSSRSNESTTVPADHQASQSDWSEEEDPLAPQWADSLPPQTLDSLLLSARLRKRQEVIHELIVSEGSHVRWLKVLGVDFLRPLEKQPSLLPPDELRALFPNLPGVRERHVKLYADLRALRNDSSNHIVQIRPVADAMLGTLGDSGYASCLSRFCRGQRLALETLRERRRKNKELHHFLSAREQLPRCGRLQLRDLLACVWQRLTKYQLLLEGILKTVCESDSDSDEDIAQLKRAHDTAKDVLQSVDTAIRTAENDHRLRTIQNKLEVRAASEWEELRRLDLTQRQLRMEGELAVRHDGNKKISVLALMLTDVLVLLQREGDKFVLRPIPAPSQQAPLSPLVKWDKVLFRPNAAARNTFFLMNINGVQMHELSTNTPAEYATWVKNIQECPLAKLAEQKPNLTPQHQHSASRSTDDGSNVSRNPSDASEKSTTASEERDRASAERERERAVSAEREREKEPEKKEEEKEREKDEVVDREDKHVPRRPTMSRVSTHEAPPPRALEPHAAVTVSPPRARLAHTATRAFTPQEQLRRLDDVINRSLRAKSAVVAELLGVPADSYAQVADLAVAESLGQCDTSGELRLQRSVSNEEPSEIHTLLLAALTQANQLTESLSRALRVSEAAAVASRARGRCERCARHPLQRSSTLRANSRDNAEPPPSPPRSPGRPEDSRASDSFSMLETISSLEKEISFDMLSDLEPIEPSAEDALESNASSASLALSLVPLHAGLQRTLGRLLTALPALEATRRDLRREIPALRDANDALRHAHTNSQLTEEISYPANILDQSLQDQPSNGG